MTTSTELLRMIESVDPSDAKMMDDINLKFWRFYYQNTEEDDRDNYLKTRNKWHVAESRDALKEIRPHSFAIRLYKYNEGVGNWSECQMTSKAHDWDWNKGISSKSHPTEELAELHAIIQAIEYERNNGA